MLFFSWLYIVFTVIIGTSAYCCCIYGVPGNVLIVCVACISQALLTLGYVSIPPVSSFLNRFINALRTANK